jgi:pyridinium-3,5-biscarboxylic acid mononucleotide synthase
MPRICGGSRRHDTLRDILRRLVAGEVTEDEAIAQLRRSQLDELGGRARLDLGRYLRRGIPEVVLAPGKAPADAARLAVRLAEQHGQGLISRMTAEHRAALDHLASQAGMQVVAYQSAARVARRGFAPERIDARIAILTAGTSDVPVAEEARMVVEACGVESHLDADLGVAGLHRFVAPLAAALDWGADVVIVAAGMDGVLPGLVAGLVDVPVIGLPVSTGYGRGGAGEAALNTMLQSCSMGLTVVNIDNGIGAGTAAVLIAQRAAHGRRRGRRTATIASTIAPANASTNSATAAPREKSTPPGRANTTPNTSAATRIPSSSHGKPRRRRP